jgi:cold shock CspA family protein
MVEFISQPTSTTEERTDGRAMGKLTGTIRKIVGDRGFGFIAADGGQPDHFLHVRDCADDLLPFTDALLGEHVSFDSQPGQNGKGPMAVNVTRL